MIRFVLKKTLNVLATAKLSTNAERFQFSPKAWYAFYSTQRSLPPDADKLRSIKEDYSEWEANLIEIDKKRLFEMRVELTEMYQSGARVCDPNDVTPSQWKQILALKARSARLKTYQFMGRKAALKSKYKRKREEHQIEGEKRREKVLTARQYEDHIVYSLGRTTIYTKIFNRTMDKWRNMRVWNAVRLNGPKIVFDMDYDGQMSTKLRRYTALHLKNGIADNRNSHSPFAPYLCNVNMKAETMKQVQTLIPNIQSAKYPIQLEEKCFTEMFPKEQLIYVTPYSPNVLKDYDANDIFVIPGILDYGFGGPVTMAKAKQLGIRTAYFPLNRYLNWGRGSKGLPLNIITNILLDFKNTRDWKIALRHVPARKLRSMRRERHDVNKGETICENKGNPIWRLQIVQKNNENCNPVNIEIGGKHSNEFLFKRLKEFT